MLQTRNIFEALNVGEARTVMRALRGGCKLSVIDIRHTVTASKADNVFVIRPGSDYAFNLAIINTLIAQGLYDKNYVAAHTTGFEELRAFVAPYTAAWAANECGVEAQAIETLAHLRAEAAPHVIWHPGWMTSRYSDSFQVSRTALVITALLGGFATPGGILPGRTPKDCGKPDLKKFTDLYTAPRAPGPMAWGGTTRPLTLARACCTGPSGPSTILKAPRPSKFILPGGTTPCRASLTRTPCASSFLVWTCWSA